MVQVLPSVIYSYHP